MNRRGVSENVADLVSTGRVEIHFLARQMWPFLLLCISLKVFLNLVSTPFSEPVWKLANVI